MQTAPNIVHGDWKTYQHEAERVRAMVFIAEQKVPRELEFDEDDKTAEHFISFDARHMVTGCARLLDNGRIGRVAVLRPFRGRGIGEAVMKTVLERAKTRGMKDVHLAAQVQANADAIIAELKAGRYCAFATLGDAMTYSTFGYVLEIIREAIPGVEWEIVPGITSFATLTAKAGTVLVENGEHLRVNPTLKPEKDET